MDNNDLHKLQHAFDIRGNAISTDSEPDVTLSVDIVKLITAGFIQWLEDKQHNTIEKLIIAVGMDCRTSSPQLKDACISAITKLGACAVDCGLASTPAMRMSVGFADVDADGSIMITASHLPHNKNGLKFYSKDGYLEKHDITKILEAAEDIQNQKSYLNFDSHTPIGCLSKVDVMALYSKHLYKVIKRGLYGRPFVTDQPLHGMKIVIDAGNGVAAFYKEILEHLGADTTGSIFLEPDGRFPNRTPDLNDESAFAYIKKATLDNNADLGIIFDCDAERAAIVDKDGNIYNKNTLIALASAIVLRDNPGTTIVTDSTTSNALMRFINELGGIQQRYKRGYLNVINEAKRLTSWGCEAPLAIETTGHSAFMENGYLNDSVYLASRIIVEAVKLKDQEKTIFSLIEKLEYPAEVADYRVKVNVEKYLENEDEFSSDCNDFFDKIEWYEVFANCHDGIRVDRTDNEGSSYFVIRLSIHEDILAVHIESDYKGGVEKVKKDIYSFLSEYDYISPSPLRG